MNKPKIILASGSKRRSEILSSCGIKHTTMVSHADEVHPKANAVTRTLVENAENKVRAVMSKPLAKGNTFIIGADTLVVLGDKVIGKPKDACHAKQILRSLSGSKASVYTGLTVYRTKTKKFASVCARSDIKVMPIPARDIEKYFKKLGPFDKAGGFSIEGVGSIIFDDINGSYFNILGLPMNSLKKLFDDHGYDILDLV